MRVREPVVAGQFYPRDSKGCDAELTGLLNCAGGFESRGEVVVGGLVPHAGWMCSGAVAAKVFQSLAQATSPKAIVLFGGVHRFRGREAAMFCGGKWETPVGAVEVDSRLAQRVLGHTNLIADDPYAHADEHSIEVQVPFVARLFPGVQILPIMVPPTDTAHEVGQAVGRTLKTYGYGAIVVGTTDLTHYGPSYAFTPRGTGPDANRWAKEVNDVPFIELLLNMRAEEVVHEARRNKNACSAGAAAATIALAAVLGASRGVLLEHTSSSEVLGATFPGRTDDSVGYAGLLFTAQ